MTSHQAAPLRRVSTSIGTIPFASWRKLGAQVRRYQLDARFCDRSFLWLSDELLNEGMFNNSEDGR